MDTFTWIDQDDFLLGGSDISDEYNYISIQLSKWTNQSYCQNQTEIDSKISELTVHFGITSYFFDIEDYEDPLKIFIDDDIYLFAEPNYKKEYFVRIKQDEAIDDLGMLPFSSTKEYSYYSIGSSRYDFKRIQTDNIFADFRIELDSKYTKTERRVYKFEELFGDIGGTIGILTLIGSLLVGMFSEKLYISDTIRDIYYVNKGSNSTDESSYFDNKITPLESKQLSEETKTKRENKNLSEFSIASRINETKNFENGNTNKLSNQLKSFKLFSLTAKNLFYMIWCCPSKRCSK